MISWQNERPCRVLLIEDNQGDVFLVREALRQAGLESEITTLSDGAEALGYVSSIGSRADAKQPDIILLDLNLPRNDGREILEAVRGTRYMKDVPVIVMTSIASPHDIDALAALGLQRYVRKPLDLEEFLTIGGIVREMLGGKALCTGR